MHGIKYGASRFAQGQSQKLQALQVLAPPRRLLVPQKSFRASLPCCASVCQKEKPAVRHGASPWGECFSPTAKQTKKRSRSMKNTEQTNLSEGNQKPANPTPKRYSVQKYRLSYVKERDIARITVSHRKDVADFCRQYLSTLPIEKVCIIGVRQCKQNYRVRSNRGNNQSMCNLSCQLFLFFVFVCGQLPSSSRIFYQSHNHPGGNSNPSEADWNYHRTLEKSRGTSGTSLTRSHHHYRDRLCIAERQQQMEQKLTMTQPNT